MLKFFVFLTLSISINAYAGNNTILKNKDGEELITNATNDPRFIEYDKEVKQKWYNGYANTNNLTNRQIKDKIAEYKNLAKSDIDKDGYKIHESEKSEYIANVEFLENELARRTLAAKPNVKIGMTAKQVAINTNWGRPDTVNRTALKNGVHEQWVYPGKGYLYFDNGKLVAIQD